MTRGSPLAAALVAVACGGAPANPPSVAAAPPHTLSAAPPPPPPPAPTCGRSLPAACDGAGPSYARDVRPVLERRCFSCHAGDGIAAEDHDLASLASLRAQKTAVSAMVARCAMPPPGAAALPDDEADVLLRWIGCGASGP